MQRRNILNFLAGGAMAIGSLAIASGPAAAQEVTLRVHHFMAPVASLPSKLLRPWAADLEAASNGRIKVEIFDAMALGGRPPELMDQAIDGVVDIALTLTGYTPGRFPHSEVFELPFMMTDPVATSLAYQQMIEEDFQQSEFANVKVLTSWVHGPGIIHTADGVTKLEDMTGKQMRGPTRIINDLLGELGATPVGMPLPAIPESLSKGVINGTVIPWEITPSIKLAELVHSHTEFSGKEALYTATFVLVMNRASYDALPDDLRAILDERSGAALAKTAAQIMKDADAPGRAIAEAAGNTIVVLDEAETARWKAASQPVVDRWIAEMGGNGIDGQALIERAKALIAENGG
jgi:TRAP-type C4-dicarboxylate transport system substrate-binding protein